MIAYMDLRKYMVNALLVLLLLAGMAVPVSSADFVRGPDEIRSLNLWVASASGICWGPDKIRAPNLWVA